MLPLFLAVYVKCQDHHKLHFSDTQYYRTALKAYDAGKDAYGVAPGDTPTGFIYPPIILKIAGGLSLGMPHLFLWRFYLGVIFLSVLMTPWLLSQLSSATRWFLPPVAALLFVTEPQWQSIYVTLGGNVSLILYALLLSALVWSLRHRTWSAFYLAVFLSSIVKPSFLPFLLVPLLADKGQGLMVGITSAGVVAACGLQRLLAPHLYAAFEAAVHVAIVLHKDLGLGFIGIIYEHTHTRFAAMQWTGALVAHAIAVSALVAPLWAGKRLRNEPSLSSLWIPALVVMSILANPRPLSYDHHISWVMGAFISIEWLRTAHSLAARLAGVALVLCVEVFFYLEDPEMIFAGMAIAALLLVFARIWFLRTATPSAATELEA